MTCWSPGVPASPVGASEVVRGVAVTVDEPVPVPAALTAEMRKAYEVPLVRPETVDEVDVLPVSATTVVHVSPLFADLSTL